MKTVNDLLVAFTSNREPSSCNGWMLTRKQAEWLDNLANREIRKARDGSGYDYYTGAHVERFIDGVLYTFILNPHFRSRGIPGHINRSDNPQRHSL